MEYAGVGTRLLNYVKRLAKAKNVSEVSLNSVYRAEGFYNKQGFAKTGQFKNWLATMKHKVLGGRRVSIGGTRRIRHSHLKNNKSRKNRQ